MFCQPCLEVQLLTSRVLSSIDYDIRKGRRKYDYDVYKKNHPITSKDVLNVFYLEYLKVEKDFPKQLSAIQSKLISYYQMLK